MSFQVAPYAPSSRYGAGAFLRAPSGQLARLAALLPALALLFACLLLAASADAVPITLSFELSEIGSASPQPVNGLGSVSGVSFGFEVGGSPSSDVLYGADEPRTGGGAFATALVQAPSLEGDIAGVLTLTFDSAVSDLAFDVALDDIFPLEDAFSVQLFDANLDPLGDPTSVMAELQGSTNWIEGSFSHSGDLVKEAVIDFNESVFRSTFWLDNLTFQLVPEPGAAALLASGLLGLSWIGRRRHRA